MANTLDLINESRLTGIQVTRTGGLFFLNMLDGMDVLAISFAAPAISSEWTISPESLGVVFSAALVGMTVGAVFVSPYSDAIGRRKVMLVLGPYCEWHARDFPRRIGLAVDSPEIRCRSGHWLYAREHDIDGV